MEVDEQAILLFLLEQHGLTLDDVDNWFVKQWSPCRSTLFAHIDGDVLKIDIETPKVTVH